MFSLKHERDFKLPSCFSYILSLIYLLVCCLHTSSDNWFFLSPLQQTKRRQSFWFDLIIAETKEAEIFPKSNFYVFSNGNKFWFLRKPARNSLKSLLGFVWRKFVTKKICEPCLNAGKMQVRYKRGKWHNKREKAIKICQKARAIKNVCDSTARRQKADDTRKYHQAIWNVSVVIHLFCHE